MSEHSFEIQVQLARESLINWMVDAGAELASESEPYDDLDEDDEEFTQDRLTCLLLNDVEYYVGPATCDPSSFDEWVTDKDYRLVAVSQKGHHHLEIAAIAILGSPLSLETIKEKVAYLQPDIAESYVKVGDTFSDGTMKPSFCEPFVIEVSTEEGDNNVWVTRRFRVNDFESGLIAGEMSELIELVNKVRQEFSLS